MGPVSGPMVMRLCDYGLSFSCIAMLVAIVDVNYWTLDYRPMAVASVENSSAVTTTAATSHAVDEHDSAANNRSTEGFNLSLVLAGIHV